MARRTRCSCFTARSSEEDDLVAFAQRLGELEIHLRQTRSTGRREVMLVSNKKENGAPIGRLGNQELNWRSMDQIFMEKPTAGTLLYAVEVTPEGGDTWFCDLGAAYAELPPHLRAVVDGRDAVHSAATADRRVGIQLTEAQRTRAPEVVHPLVRTHPLAREKSLYFSMNHTARLDGMSEEDSLPILGELRDHATNPRFVYAHHWRVGDPRAVGQRSAIDAPPRPVSSTITRAPDAPRRRAISPGPICGCRFEGSVSMMKGATLVCLIRSPAKAVAQGSDSTVLQRAPRHPQTTVLMPSMGPGFRRGARLGLAASRYGRPVAHPRAGVIRNLRHGRLAMPRRLVIVDPGHFHAALVQKEMYAGLLPEVNVYAPVGLDLADYLTRIARFNTRADNPTAWTFRVHAGPDYLTRLRDEEPGGICILSGRNRNKIGLIEAAVEAGLHVLADKPAIIRRAVNCRRLERRRPSWPRKGAGLRRHDGRPCWKSSARWSAGCAPTPRCSGTSSPARPTRRRSR